MSVTIMLVDPGGTEYDLYYSSSGYSSGWPEFPSGIGYPPFQHISIDKAYSDGGRLLRVKKLPRVVDVPVNIGSTALNVVLTGLKRYYTAGRLDQTALKPCKLKVTANSKTAYLDVYPDSDPLRQDGYGRVQRLYLRFIAYNPQWYYSTQNSTTPTLNGTVNLPYIARRSAGTNTAAWDSMGGGADSSVLCLAIAPNGDIYAGGYFTQIGGVSANYIARWNGSSWSALGSGMNGAVFSLAIAPNGDVYAGGRFTTAGDTSADYIARWNGSSWSALDSGTNHYVKSIAIAPNGDVYAGGMFTTAGGVTVNRIARWNGSEWTALGSGMNDAVSSIAIAPNGDVYAGGYFTTAGDTSADYIARWNGSSWSALGSGMNDAVSSIAIAPNGDVYAGGYFTTAGGVTVNRIARWNGSKWTALGSGMNDRVLGLAIAPNGDVYAGGKFTTAGGMPINDRIAIWNGYRWLSADVDLSNDPLVNVILADPFIIGTDKNSGSSVSAYTTQVTNNGSHIKPVIEINGQCTLQSIFNETTGKRLWFNITLQAGEKLTIDCEKLTITSSWRGNMLSALMPGSNFADFTLESGNNNITVFATNTSGASASIKWHNRYDTLAEAIG